MTSEKTRINIFAFHLYQVKGIYKTISGPDFSSVACFLFEMNYYFRFCHIRNLWIATENSDLSPTRKYRFALCSLSFKQPHVTRSIYANVFNANVFNFSWEKRCFAGESQIKLQMFPIAFRPPCWRLIWRLHTEWYPLVLRLIFRRFLDVVLGGCKW